MNVEVRDGLAAVWAVVDHHAEAAFRQAEVGGDLRGGEKELTEDRLIPGLRLADARDDLIGNNQDVNRCLRGNIAEDEAMFVAVYHVSGDFTVADFLENRLHCGRNLAWRGLSGKLEKSGGGRFLLIRLARGAPHGLVRFVPISENRRSGAGRWKTTLLRGLLICAGSVTILLPAWLPNRPGAPLERGTVELMQAALLAAATVVMAGAMAHSGHRRAVCRVLAFGLAAALVGELEDFISGIMKWPFPDAWVIGALLGAALITIIRHRRVMLRFFETMGHHAGAGLGSR